MKTKILELLKGMTSDSKSESYKCERELCEILTNIYKKIEKVERSAGAYERDYPDRIVEIDMDNVYKGIKKIPDTIWCNYGSFDFVAFWLDMDLKSYFETLKEDAIKYKQITIENVEASLNKHKDELETLKNTNFESLDLN